MRQFLARQVIAAPVIFCLCTPTLAQSPADLANLSTAVEAAEAQSWVPAFTAALKVGDGVSVEIIDWIRLREDGATWPEYLDFINRNPDFPGMWAVYRAAEPEMPEDLPAAEVIQFFETEAPRTGHGARLLVQALEHSGRATEAKLVLETAWRELSLLPEDQAAIASRWGSTLRPLYYARLDHLIWEGLLSDAERMLPLVTAEQRALAEARIALRRGEDGVDALIARVPSRLQFDGGLAFERMRWRMRKGRWASAADLMITQSRSDAALGQPRIWADRRRSLARDTMRDGDGARAYQLASNHFLPADHSSYADLEWLSGFIALRQLNDPKRAIAHFERFRDVVGSPISHGRAGYWLGRAYEALGDADRAHQAYGYGAAYQTSFYGQLAAQRAGFPADPGLIGPNSIADWNGESYAVDPRSRAALMLAKAGEFALAEWFVVKVTLDFETRAEYAGFARMFLDEDLPYFALRVAKRAANEGHILMDSYYPLTALSAYRSPVRPELQMAIARQESELNPRATSPVGALGLMQVMPKTAAGIAGDLGIPYSEDRMLSDWSYNARIATQYLSDRLSDFDGSLVKTAAAYNAGPARVADWVGRFGDPSTMTHEGVIDWIEKIPFRETRNYVMRVMEALHVYRQRIGGGTMPLRLIADLERG